MSLHLRVPLHEDGPALWPGYISLGDLEGWREEVGTPIFETMWQGRRGGLAGQIIRQEFFRYYRGDPPGVTFMAVDPAISTKTTADETAIVVGNVEATDSPVRWEFTDRPDDEGSTIRSNVYLRWFWHGRVGLKDTEDIIFKAWSYYRPVAIGIEAVAYQSALVQLLENDHPELPIEPVTPDRDKLSRFLALARLYEFGRIYHHPSLTGSAYEYQLTHLPGRHDDMADAAAYLTEMSGVAGGAVVMAHRPEGFR